MASITRRGLLGILAAGFAPAAIGSGILMPVRQIARVSLIDWVNSDAGRNYVYGESLWDKLERVDQNYPLDTAVYEWGNETWSGPADPTIMYARSLPNRHARRRLNAQGPS